MQSPPAAGGHSDAKERVCGPGGKGHPNSLSQEARIRPGPTGQDGTEGQSEYRPLPFSYSLFLLSIFLLLLIYSLSSLYCTMQVSCPPGGTFYIWVDLSLLPPSLNNGMAFFEAGIKHKVICVPGIFFGMSHSHLFLSLFISLSIFSHFSSSLFLSFSHACSRRHQRVQAKRSL